MKLTDICDFQGGSQPPKNEWSFEKKDDYVRMLQIRDFTQADRVTPEYVKISNRLRYCDEDDILIGRYGASVGKILTGKSGAYNVAIMKTIPDTSKVRKEFMKYYFSASLFQNYILNLGGRAAQAGFSKEDLERLDFNPIDFDSQDQAIKEFHSLEKSIINKNKELHSLDELIKSRFIEMFDNENYPIKRIDEVAVLKSGTTFDKKYELTQGDMLYCKVSDMNLSGNEKYMTTSKTFVSFEIGKKPSIPANSVIFPKRGGAIGTNKKRITIVDTCVDLNTMGVTPTKYLNIQYLYQFFQNFDLLSICDGSAIPQLNNKNIGPLEITVPPIELQKEFASFVELIDKSKFVNHSKYFLCEIFTFTSSTIAYSSVVSILACPSKC